MQRCLSLARQGLGKTAPNPLVGSVIIQDDQVVGEGFHPRAGEPHAEIFALRQAGDHAWRASLYVNLEPCNHYGRTPPCTEAIIQAGISRVVVGMIDPNPLVAGKGIERLRQAGLSVTVGVESSQCQRLNEAFCHRIQHHRPWGILKYAMTLDGKIATTTGHSTWVTGEPARRWVHQTRSYCQAVIVGGNTVRRDNPRLTCHGVAEPNPLRVVLSRSLDLPRQANLWNVSQAPTLVCTQAGNSPEIQACLRDQGVEIVELDALTPDRVMALLYERDCLQVLWECGGQLAAPALATGAIQKLMAFIAPKIIGGTQAPTPVGDLGLTLMTEALPLRDLSYQTLGEDLLIEAYLPAKPGPNG
ncbi:riboflavin biosynthesis protein RibD [Synechocystis sp. LKSZ1]